jgi:hypothetical protein
MFRLCEPHCVAHGGGACCTASTPSTAILEWNAVYCPANHPPPTRALSVAERARGGGASQECRKQRAKEQADAAAPPVQAAPASEAKSDGSVRRRGHRGRKEAAAEASGATWRLDPKTRAEVLKWALVVVLGMVLGTLGLAVMRSVKGLDQTARERWEPRL